MDINQVAVIILNYKSWQDTLAEALLVHDKFNLDWNQIIIVDNASPNESEKELSKKTIGNYVFIETGDNKGYAFGNNVGLRFAYEKGFKYGWILNNDIVIEDDNVLGEMLRVFDSDKNVAVVNPDIFSPSGYMFNRDSKRRNMWDFTLGYFSYKKKGRKLVINNGYGYIWRPQGCCMLVDLIKLNEVNYMDEHTFLYCEEIILAERFLNAGYKIACACGVNVIHNHSKTVKTVLQKKEITNIHLNSYKYYLKEYRHYNAFQIWLCVVFKRLEIERTM